MTKYYANIFNNWFIKNGFSDSFSYNISFFFEILLTVLLFISISKISKIFFLRIINSVVRKTTFKWDDILMEMKVFDRFGHLIPAFISHLIVPYIFVDFPDFLRILLRFIDAYIIFILMMILISLFNTIEYYLKLSDNLKDKPIDSYFQLLKLISFFLGGILIFSKILDRDPQGILTAIGALTAVLLLVFKDTILGFVASIQLSANDMIRVGDWVSMHKYGADGEVIKITLNTVKVQNWDKTISTIPTYSFVSDSFKNWRGMTEAGGRRIKRSILISVNSISFCEKDLLDKLIKIELLNKYFSKKISDLSLKYSKNYTLEEYIRNLKLTNIGLFRIYAKEFIDNNKFIHQNLTKMIIQKEGGKYGIPIEVYCFSKSTEWSQYEKLQAEIFDHLYAISSLFNLEIYQDISGKDVLNVNH